MKPVEKKQTKFAFQKNDLMKRFATLNHQNLLENLSNTEVVFYATLFKSEKLILKEHSRGTFRKNRVLFGLKN